MTRLQQYVKQYLSIPSWNQEERKFFIWQWLQEMDKIYCNNHIKFLDSLRVYKCKVILTVMFEYDCKVKFTFTNTAPCVCTYDANTRPGGPYVIISDAVVQPFITRVSAWLNEEVPDV